MNEQELTRAIAKKFFLTLRESREVIDFIISKIIDSLSQSKRSYFRGFGSFTKKKYKSKKVRHPKTGKLITIPERTTVDFSPSKDLLQKIK
jgi:nucleoid DNA-binding protein